MLRKQCKCGCGELAKKGNIYVLGHNEPFKGKRHTEETIEKMRKARVGIYVGKNAPWYGRKHSKSTKEKMSKALEGHNALSGKDHYLYGKSLPEETKRKMRESWTEERRKRTGELAISRIKSRFQPSKFEMRITKLIKVNHLPYKYVGDFKLIIEGKCPDFIHTTKKIVVEAYDDYWKDEDYVPVRRTHFKKFGYKTLFIHYHDSEKKMIQKLKEESS